MPNAHRDDATDSVEIAPSCFVKEVLTMTLHDRDGILVVVKDRRRQMFLAHREYLGGGWACVWRGLKIAWRKGDGVIHGVVARFVEGVAPERKNQYMANEMANPTNQA